MYLCHFIFFYPQVYNDANILEKIVKDKQKELGPPPEEDDVGSPKLKLRMFFFFFFGKNWTL